MSKARVIVADDEESMRYFVTRTLGRHGYDAVAAGDGEDAVRQFDTLPADVAVVDLKMPGLGGLAVLQELRRRDPEVIVIVMTSPCFRKRGGVCPAPTPAGVPVRITVPVASVIPRESSATISRTPTIIVDVDACCTIAPFSRVMISRSCGSATASAFTIGPIGQNVSKLFPRTN